MTESGKPNIDPEALKKAREILERFQKEILEPNAAALRLQVDYLKDKNIYEFGKIAGRLIKQSLDSLHQMLEMPVDAEFEAVCPGLGDNIIYDMVGDFNEVLPLDFPYLIAVLEPTEHQAFIMFVTRKSIPGIHDILKTRLVPIFNPPGGIDGYFRDISELADYVKKRKEDKEDQEKN